jgi:hypothetical protein
MIDKFVWIVLDDDNGIYVFATEQGAIDYVQNDHDTHSIQREVIFY